MKKNVSSIKISLSFFEKVVVSLYPYVDNNHIVFIRIQIMILQKMDKRLRLKRDMKEKIKINSKLNLFKYQISKRLSVKSHKNLF